MYNKNKQNDLFSTSITRLCRPMEREYCSPSYEKCIVDQTIDDVKDLLYGIDTISQNGVIKP